MFLELTVSILFAITDIDECGSSSSICSNGHCENFMGGYQCICNPGYMPNDLKSMCVGECMQESV